ncbi:hypothetical protein BJY21_001228 [Kineosphaera limosa]|uniref:hypothetical protein n=1 Tax=Kineosphaera limosa TaxID=111564 RepID=UPI0012FAFC67|nr:hypothetical protein [Kineosphaera limosa]NYE00044.1 hypothetical protein [Kineosphaera limosa]
MPAKPMPGRSSSRTRRLVDLVAAGDATAAADLAAAHNERSLAATALATPAPAVRDVGAGADGT